MTSASPSDDEFDLYYVHHPCRVSKYRIGSAELYTRMVRMMATRTAWPLWLRQYASLMVCAGLPCRDRQTPPSTP